MHRQPRRCKDRHHRPDRRIFLSQPGHKIEKRCRKHPESRHQLRILPESGICAYHSHHRCREGYHVGGVGERKPLRYAPFPYHRSAARTSENQCRNPPPEILLQDSGEHLQISRNNFTICEEVFKYSLFMKIFCQLVAYFK